MARGRKGKKSRGKDSENDRPARNHQVANKNIDKRSRPKKKKKKILSAAPAPAPDIPDPTSTDATNGGGAARREAKKEEMAKEDHREKKERSSPGFIFICSSKTKPECYKYRVFGLPAGKMSVIETIKPGAKLFLFDFDLKLLYGVYKATSRGERGLEPAAFGGRFPAQVRFKIFKVCLPLPERAFRHAIEENYDGGSKFRPQLSNHQVKKLIDLFRPIGVPPTVTVAPPPQMSPVRDRYRQPARLPPPEDPYHHAHTPPTRESRHHTYLRENTHLPGHDPYNTRYRAVPDVVTQDLLVRESEYHRLLLLEKERDREREREMVQHLARADDYYVHPRHDAAPPYVPRPLHAPPPLHALTSYGALSYDVPASYGATSSHALTSYGSLSYDAPSSHAPAASHTQHYWGTVADEDPNRVYVDPLHRMASRTANLAGSSYSFPGTAPAYRGMTFGGMRRR